jgi:peptidyl-prolyl cis-trans isomerase A (cyclophilin A)
MNIRSIGIGMLVAAAAVAGVGAQARQSAPVDRAALLRNPAALKDKAPESFKVRFDTTRGAIVVDVHRDWAPLGADRFYNLVKAGFFDGERFYRVVPNFMVQWGFNGEPSVTAIWDRVKLKDDPVKQSNKRGYITFANTGGPDSRGTNVFINYKDNAFLDAQRFAPFGEVVEGMDVADKINAEYKELPNQNSIRTQGNAYLSKAFPKMDYIKKATIEP